MEYKYEKIGETYYIDDRYLLFSSNNIWDTKKETYKNIPENIKRFCNKINNFKNIYNE